MGAVFVGRPSAPVVVQRIAGEEGRLIRRALGAQTADCAGLVIDRLSRAGGGGFQVLCIHGLRREVVGQLFAILSLAKLTDGILGAGRFAAGVLRVAVLSRVIRYIAVFIGTFMPVMRCIGRPIGLPAMARSWNRLYFCCVALGAAICLFARFCAGRRCCYRTVVPSMRAYVILFIATGTLLPVLVIIMCPTGSKIMSQSIAIFRTANCACCSLGAGRRAAVAILGFRMAGVTLTDSGVGLFIAVLRPSAPVVPKRFGRSAANRACPSACASRRSAPNVCLSIIPFIITHRACNRAFVQFIICVLISRPYRLYLVAFSTKRNIRRICRHRHNSQHHAQYEHNAQNFLIHIVSSPLLSFDSLKSYFISNMANSLYITSVAIALISSD